MAFMTALEINTNLASLNLQFNDAGDETTQTIEKALKSNKNLTSMVILPLKKCNKPAGPLKYARIAILGFATVFPKEMGQSTHPQVFLLLTLN
ncbi:hypothetical protein BC936DRAFT_148218 [Jimgerdemannia flammicorona]|uniref:Uncharacterized protein n=1 Tax=Jimgerdemannia flammicorona TaxID=994334 RepID=A0A433D3J2_9FUNG|nr:hypothetical protein BC936DRAFT_148218 [Jimgerdemannia flammicorona]